SATTDLATRQGIGDGTIGMNLAGWLERNARRFGDRPAISQGRGVHATYGQFAARVAIIAAHLAAACDHRTGERVAVIMTNRPEYLEALFAVWHAGLVAVPVNAKLHRDEFRYILDHSGARLAIISADLAEAVAPLADELPGLASVAVVGEREWRQWQSGDGMAL